MAYLSADLNTCHITILQVNTDKVKEKVLDQYRNKCQPVFLLYKVNKQNQVIRLPVTPLHSSLLPLERVQCAGLSVLLHCTTTS